MSFTPQNNPSSGISITGSILGVVVEVSRDQKYTNYRMGVGTDSMPDKFGQVTQVTNEIELNEQQYQRLTHTIQSNLYVPCRVWLEVRHRAGERNGKVWEIMTLHMRHDSEIEFFEVQKITPAKSPASPSSSPLALEPKPEKLPDAVKKF